MKNKREIERRAGRTIKKWNGRKKDKELEGQEERERGEGGEGGGAR